MNLEWIEKLQKKFIEISYIVKSELYPLDLLNTAHRRLVCLTIINPLYASINSPFQVYETYLTDDIIYYCAIGGWKAGSRNQKICL